MLVAVSMCKDEADIAEATLTRMARQVDRLIVADNGSTDGTREILDRLADSLPLTVLDDPDPAYYQAEKMTALARRAREEEGATWVLPFDFDEVWLPRTGGTISDLLATLDPAVLVVEAQLFDHVATGTDSDLIDDPVARLVWRRAAPAPLRKVAARARPDLQIQQGNHGATFDVPHPPTVTDALEVRHFPYRSVSQFVSKARNGAAAYAAADLPPEVGAHWRGYGRILDERGEAGIADVFFQWFWRDDPNEPIVIGNEQQPALAFDPCP